MSRIKQIVTPLDRFVDFADKQGVKEMQVAEELRDHSIQIFKSESELRIITAEDADGALSVFCECPATSLEETVIWLRRQLRAALKAVEPEEIGLSGIEASRTPTGENSEVDNDAEDLANAPMPAHVIPD